MLWCIGGGFNVTRFPSGRSEEGCYCPAMMEFSDFIFEHDLIDLPLAGVHLCGLTIIVLFNKLLIYQMYDITSLVCALLKFSFDADSCYICSFVILCGCLTVPFCPYISNICISLISYIIFISVFFLSVHSLVSCPTQI